MDIDCETEPVQHYQIVVEGALDAAWGAWFSDLTIEISETDETITTLTGPVVDQVALRGILNRLWDLNLSIVSIKRMRI